MSSSKQHPNIATSVNPGMLSSLQPENQVWGLIGLHAAPMQVVLSGPMNCTKAHSMWLRQQGQAVHLVCFAAFAAGAAAMSVIGKWA
jgi:hypothetical protein